MTCPSVYTWVVGRTLRHAPCLVDAGHTGQCHDAYGHVWTRVGEILRQDREKVSA